MDARKASRYGALTGLVAAAALVAGMAAATASPASSASSPVHAHGVLPTVAKVQAARAHVNPAITSNTLQYGGGIDGIGVTSGKEKVYIVFWGTQWGTSSTDSNGNLKFTNDSL